MRKNFADILKTAKIDLFQEYIRLYTLFYRSKDDHGETLKIECESSFLNIPFRGTCLSLDDFNQTHNFFFEPEPQHFDPDYLIKFCEYTYNLIVHLEDRHSSPFAIFYLQQMMKVLDLMDYKWLRVKDMNVNILVPQKQEALAVAEIVKEEIAYSVLEYNHHSLKGNLPKKKATLKLMADDIEPQRKILNGINKTLADNLFQMFQKFVRHNNEDNWFIKNLSKEALEMCYDDIYQMWLLAKLEIDNLERKKRIEFILQKINTK